MCLCTGILEVAVVGVVVAAVAKHRKKTAPEVIPAPGSDEALTAGCKCPVLDNGHGTGSGWGPGKFWVNGDCPLHGGEAARV